jgi:hypothetical protein
VVERCCRSSGRFSSTIEGAASILFAISGLWGVAAFFDR